MPDETVRDPAATKPIRDLVREAVERAWAGAMASGALPAWPADAVRPAVEVERPADAVHGDFASNLALRLARPLRMPPLAIAAALAAELVAAGCERPGIQPGPLGRYRATRIPEHADPR